LPVGAEALAVICPLLIGLSRTTFSPCTDKFAKFHFLARSAEKWVVGYKKMSIQEEAAVILAGLRRTNV
jgi:hypothetical protein